MKQGVEVKARPVEEDMPALFAVLINWFPMLLSDWCLDIFYAPDAVRWWTGNGIWEIQGEVAD